MAALVNRICKLCGVKTWEEDGFIQCDCIMVDKNDWEHGVAETPKEWVEKQDEEAGWGSGFCNVCGGEHGDGWSDCTCGLED